ncbi:serine/threonine-protein kinase [Streptomyces sp. NPDC046821]|uniref:serine/threonine-protein kinase n=1 Tax=Streptomyces sp. NPDC046821 TaxID=3154702 RepID=UPI0033ED8880
MLLADRYRLHRTVGRGGMGEVWEATDEMLGRTVAVKLLIAQDSDPSAAARFRMEAQTSASLSHPHVVGVYDFGAWEHRFYLVMELVDGGSLAQVAAGGAKLGPERVADIAAGSAAGLAAAHRQGVVHRDIKPGNLLLTSDGTVKLGDFGIARFMDDPAAGLTTTGQIVGTGLYLAPERALGKVAGPASDVYSLGCVLYQLLTGNPPFQADTATALLYQHVDAAPVPPNRLGVPLPPSFENYLLGLLAKKPEDRPTAQEVSDWFRSGAWRGRPEPLPEPAPAPPAPPAYAPSAPAPAPETTGTTYQLPSTGRAASRRGARSGFMAAARRRPRVYGTVGAATLFGASLVIGMVLFAPDDSGANTPKADPSPAASASSGQDPMGTAPSPDAAQPVDSEATPPPEADDQQQNQDQQTDQQQTPQPNGSEYRQKWGNWNQHKNRNEQQKQN